MWRNFAAITTLSLTACSSTPLTDGAEVTTRDSAGVEIVETGRSVWGDMPRWRVDSTPLLVVGNVDGEDAYLFARVAGAVLLEDGSLVVADAASRELRRFGPDGAHIATVGRKGPGPAEFSEISRFARCGDELWIDSYSRISVWSTDLEYRREFVMADMAMWPFTCFDGTGVLTKQDRSPGETPPNTVYTDSLQLAVVDSLGEGRTVLFTVPLWEYLLVQDARGGYGFRPPFGRSTVVHGDGTDLLVGLAHSLSLERYDRRGQLIRIARGPHEDLSLTREMLDRYENGPLPGRDTLYRRLMKVAGNPHPEAYPAYTDLIVDQERHAWVKRFVHPGQNGNRWGIFDPAGAFLGHLDLPADLDVLEIGRSHVVGIARDADDVPQVHVYRLHR